MNKRCLFRGFHPNEDGKTTIKVTLIGHDEPFTFKGDWIYGIPFSRIGGGLNPMGINAIRRDDNNCICTVVAETVGQWVMADKDDNDIFEGDTIGIHQFLFDGSEHENELIGRVVWDDERVCWAVDHIDHKQIQRYMSYDNDVEFEKVKIPLCELYGLHEESYQRTGNSWEAEV